MSISDMIFERVWKWCLFPPTDGNLKGKMIINPWEFEVLYLQTKPWFEKIGHENDYLKQFKTYVMVLTLVINGLSTVSRFISLIMTDLPSCKWDEVPQFIAWLTITRFPWWVFGDETTIVPWVKITEVTEQGAPPSATFYGTIFKPMNIDHIGIFFDVNSRVPEFWPAKSEKSIPTYSN